MTAKLAALAVAAAVLLATAGPAGSREPDRQPVILGDSLTVYASDELARLPGDITVWARGGWTVAHWEPVIGALADARWPVVVLALGTNDSTTPTTSLQAWKRSLNRLRTAGTCVVFPRPGRAPKLAAERVRFLDDLDRLVATYPNVRVVDWEGNVARHRRNTGYVDGLHHTQELQDWYAYVLWLAAHHTCEGR